MACPPPPPALPLPGDTFSVGEVIKLLAMSIGLIYFSGLISYDLWTALASKARVQWIPAKTLVLSALTLQILTLLELKDVSMPDNPNHDELLNLSNNQLAIDSGRLVLCVFIGYMLPGMAGAGPETQWGNIAALNVCVFTAIISELYYVRITVRVFLKKFQIVSSCALARDQAHPACELIPYEDISYYVSLWAVNGSKAMRSWLVGSSVVFLVSTVILILLLISSVLAGSTVRNLVTKRIICLMESTKMKGSGEEFEEEILRSWLLAHVGQPQYIISRSVLCSATGVIVTVCVILLAFKAIYLHSMDIVPRRDGWNWLRHTTFGLQCFFVLEGWAVVLWRWFCAIAFSPKSASSAGMSLKDLTLCPKCSMEDFWTRSIRDLRESYEMHKWRPTSPNSNKRPQNRRKKLWAFMTSAAMICKKCKIYFQLHFLLAMQTLLVFFGKFSSLFSEMLCRCFVRRPNYEESGQEFKKYRKALEHLCMPGESAESLWFANEKSFNKVKASMQKGRQDGQEECQDLRTLLMERFQFDQSNRFVNQLKPLPLVQEYFPFLEENPWKITAVSLLKIIMTVFPLYKAVDPNAVTKAVEAYQQAWEAMTFVERSHVQAPDSLYEAKVLEVKVERVSLASDIEFKKLLRLRDSPSSKDNFANAPEAIENLKAEAQEQLQTQKLLDPETRVLPQDKTHLRDSKDWNVVATSYSMYRVCELVLRRVGSDTSVKALFPELHRFLADVIGSCLLELPEALVNRCRKWAILYDEENILEAISIAGKIRGVMDEKWTPTVKKLPLSKSKWVLFEDKPE